IGVFLGKGRKKSCFHALGQALVGGGMDGLLIASFLLPDAPERPRRTRRCVSDVVDTRGDQDLGILKEVRYPLVFLVAYMLGNSYFDLFFSRLIVLVAPLAFDNHEGYAVYEEHNI